MTRLPTSLLTRDPSAGARSRRRAFPLFSERIDRALERASVVVFVWAVAYLGAHVVVAVTR